MAMLERKEPVETLANKEPGEAQALLEVQVDQGLKDLRDNEEHK